MRKLPLNGQKFIYLSEGDIKYDSRILRSIEVASKNGAEVLGFGIIDKIAPSSTSIIGKNSKILSINLFSRKIPFKIIKYFFSIIEYNIKGLLFALNNNPTQIHCNDYVPLPLAILIKIFCRSKLIYDAHELESRKHGQSKFTSILVYILEFICWPFIDSFITVSPSIKRWYSKSFPKKINSVVLNTPYIKKNFIPKNDYLRKKYLISKKLKIFIYVGVLTKGRCLTEIINCFKQKEISEKASLIFLGSGPLKKKLISMTTSDDQIFFHEPVASEEVINISSSADYGIRIDRNQSLSHKLSLPNKIFEYIFAGLPVLTAPNNGDVKNLINKLKVGVVCEPNLVSMIKAIKKIIKKNINFDSNLQKFYKYSWDYQSQNLLNLYIRTNKK